MTHETPPNGNPRNSSYPPAQGGKAIRRAVIVIACLSICILLYQTFRPRHGGGKDNIPWRTNLTDAMAEAKKSGKPLLVDFSASWCPPCQEMKNNSWPDKQVEEVAKRDYIPVLLDADRPEAEEPSKKYGVEYIPAVFILDADGKVLRKGDFMARDELLSFLKSAKAG